MKYKIASIFIVMLIINFNQEVCAQNLLSVISLASHRNDCPNLFKKFVENEYGFRYNKTRAYEARTIVDQEFVNEDSMILIRSFSCKTILNCGDKKIGIDLPYIKGSKSYNPASYKSIIEKIAKTDKVEEMKMERWDHIELKNIPELVMRELMSQFVSQGGTSIGESDLTSFPSIFMFKNLFKVQIDMDGERYKITIRDSIP